MAGTLIAPGSDQASAEISVTTTEVTIGLYVTAGGPIPPFIPPVTVEKKAPGDVYTPVAEMSPAHPMINLLSSFGPGTYNVRRGATNADVGVFYDPAGDVGGGGS